MIISGVFSIMGLMLTVFLLYITQSMGLSQSIKAPGWEEPAYRLRYMAVRLTDPAMGVGKDYSDSSIYDSIP